MKKDFTMIACVLDRSGSMGDVVEDSIGGFNTFLEDQKKVGGEVKMSVVLFDHEYQIIHDFVDINDVLPLNKDTYVPRGMTALLDAVGRTVDDVGEKLNGMSEEDRPENVVFVILTDGHENNSARYNILKVKDMIQHQQDKYSWKFIFLGANQDAFDSAANIGINRQFVGTYCGDSDGTKHAYRAISCSLNAIRKKCTEGFSTQDCLDDYSSQNSVSK